MKFLFKYTDFAKCAWSLAAGMLFVSIVTIWRMKPDGLVTGLTVGMPLGVLILWLFYTIKLQTARRRTRNGMSASQIRNAVAEAPTFGTIPSNHFARVRSRHDTHTTPPSSQDIRNRSLLGRDPLIVNHSRKSRALDQWHR